MEAIAVLVSKMTCMRPELSKRGLGECFKTKPDFMKVLLGSWRGHIANLLFVLLFGHTLFGPFGITQFSYYAMNGSVTWMELNCYGDVQRMPVMMSF